MSIFLVVIHVIVCIALIMIVLLQTGKGADMGAAFGGGASQTLFGATGASSLLSKLTTAAAVIFMLTSLTLAYMSGNRAPDSILSEPPQGTEQPATQAAPPADNQTSDTKAAEPQASQPQPSEQAPATQESAPAPTAQPQDSGQPAEQKGADN